MRNACFPSSNFYSQIQSVRYFSHTRIFGCVKYFPDVFMLILSWMIKNACNRWLNPLSAAMMSLFHKINVFDSYNMIAIKLYM